jgi:uncharacterized protein YndB with AHSA1/START domain
VSPPELSRWQAEEVRALSESRLLLRWPGLGAGVELELLEQEPARYLRLRAAPYEIEVRFEPGRLEFLHHGTTGSDETEGIASAWRTSLGLLRHYLEHHHGKPRRVIWLMRTVRAPAAAVHVFFSDPAALASWFGRGRIGDAGSPLALDLIGAGRMSGSVLAHTPGRDVALSWEERANSALVLRTLPEPEGARKIVLMWSRWGDDAADTGREQAALEAALDRLARLLNQPARA